MTDATAAMGLPPGLHQLGDVAVQLDSNHRMTVKGTNTLAGSAASLDACVRNFASFGTRKQEELAQVASSFLSCLNLGSYPSRSIFLPAGLDHAARCASLHPAQVSS